MDGPVTVVTIDRPERRNAVDSATAGRLLEAFVAFDADDGASVAVLTGAGGTSAPGPTSRRSGRATAGPSRTRVPAPWAPPG